MEWTKQVLVYFKEPLQHVVLGYIYHDLGEVVCHPDHPSKANIIFPNHYVIGWLAELFPSLYRRRLDGDCPSDFATNFHYHKCDTFFRDGRYLSLRPSSHHEDSHNGQDVIHMGLLDSDFKFLLSIRSSVLLVHIEAKLLLEPYYPNQFVRQVGFDQVIQSNLLSFSRALR
ncbi:hypothetical protein Cgig2_010803 [Carnegiea gigantea]|uniref:Uncharacterized protein n=1 Tax=Carnegiea gigantea TaxID=171969 RepID=A0A9Q1JPX1_9CARY|nr:hypothetical protein Cgig2_010803 [Carnegiea gigantea]